jgi:hypothetical protein
MAKWLAAGTWEAPTAAAYALRGQWCRKYISEDGDWTDLAGAAKFNTIPGLLRFLRKLRSGLGDVEIVRLREKPPTPPPVAYEEVGVVD